MADSSLVLGTFNVQHGLRGDGGGVVDVDLLGRACAELGADVLGLQEVDRRARRSGRADLARRAAAACGAGCAFASARRLGWWGRYGNALLVRGAVADTTTLPLPRVGRAEPRVALLASARVGARTLSVAVAHLSVREPESELQLAHVLEALLNRPGPRVLLGDLNRSEHQLDALAAAGFAVAVGGPTFPSVDPRAQIDHVAMEGLEIVNAETRQTPVSDHRALLVTVR